MFPCFIIAEAVDRSGTGVVLLVEARKTNYYHSILLSGQNDQTVFVVV